MYLSRTSTTMPFFEIKEITPYITFFGPIAGFLAIWDYLLRDSHKARVWDAIVSLAQLGRNPFSLAFYGFVTLSSVFMTVGILSVSGIAAAKSDGGSVADALKSSGPLLLAVVLKIVLFDYVLAVKSYAIVGALSVGKQRLAENQGKGMSGLIVCGAALVAYDIYFTAAITALFLNWSEMFQTRHINDPLIAEAVKPAVDFFDSMNFMAKETLSKSFYALNGALLMYASLLISAMTRGAITHLNVEDIKKNIFKVLAAAMVFCVLIVAVARHLSQ